MPTSHSTQPDRLSTSVQYIKGIGPKRAEILAERGIRTVRDLLYYFPFDYIDLSTVEKIGNLRKQIDSGKWITIIGTVKTFDLIGRPPRQRFVVVLGDDTGIVQLVFFARVNYFKGAFTAGETLAVSGKVTGFKLQPQIVHPSIDRINASEDEADGQTGFLHTKGFVPKYGSSEELRDVHLNVKGLRRILRHAVDDYIDAVVEFLPQDIVQRNEFYELPKALSSIHFPATSEELAAARERLKFDELFALQLLLALRRKRIKVDLPGISFNIESKLARRLVDALPFKLTKAQIKVVNQIAEDMKSGRPMNRLLQGDVGSGKTIVALIAMLIAVDNGYQAAFMAPTEILAEQHYQSLVNFLKDLPVNLRLLTGGQRSKLREATLLDIRGGGAQVVVGTHALIQEGVTFARLGIVIIDEQHRFGVEQRVALKDKANDHSPHPDVLVMTATPIPRTLSMTLYGDLDVSIIDEMPANRQSIKTILKTDSQRSTMYRFVREQVQQGRQVYIVYPLIEVSEKLDLRAATEGYERLSGEVFGDLRVGLLHGRMPSNEKEQVMSDIKSGNIDILVATTVIEVGIDIPNATAMVIEHAERFGLSQLHQLRGRVGRGTEQSYCILMAPDWMNRVVRKIVRLPIMPDEQVEQLKSVRRLQTMLETTNGFKIAEIDLELRGPGDFFGTRQSGLPELHIANLVTDGEILSLARKEAFNLIDHDPHLRLPEHRPLRKNFEERMKSTLSLAEVG
ncbi:MAG TPA: ATP-dependent DNA helicase RecG [Bacteroidota bacterium]|jgi:ATP-dependent DNA helicase RecG|nr:ATP-dependent DNA helicase RecG [Bacteroidota bacterium]